MSEVTVAPTRPGRRHASHIYPLRQDLDRLCQSLNTIFQALRAVNIGGERPLPAGQYASPVPEGPENWSWAVPSGRGRLRVPRHAAALPEMTDADAAEVIAAVEKVIRWARR